MRLLDPCSRQIDVTKQCHKLTSHIHVTKQRHKLMSRNHVTNWSHVIGRQLGRKRDALWAIITGLGFTTRFKNRKLLQPKISTYCQGFSWAISRRRNWAGSIALTAASKRSQSLTEKYVCQMSWKWDSKQLNCTISNSCTAAGLVLTLW